MRILVITQKVDSNDSVLGFFHRWVMEFAKKFEQVTVICLEKGTYDLPSQVKVLSLGKEERKGGAIVSRFSYLCRFYKYIWQDRQNYDVVFVHMNQEYVLLGWKLWKLLGKKIFLWRNHKKGNIFTDLAVFLSDIVFCTSKGSYTARFKKTKLMPVGVDASMFQSFVDEKNEGGAQSARIARSILFLGRISPVKRVDLLLRALDILHNNGQEFVAYFYGSPTPVDHEYFEKVQAQAHELSTLRKIIFKSEVPNSQTPAIYNQHEIFVNLTDSGSFDKTIVEAMLCETLTLVSNESLNELFENQSDQFIFKDGDAHDLAEKLQALLTLPEVEKDMLQKRMRKFAEKHSLQHLMSDLSLVLKNH